jgi:glycosyltransferase involved in cell wall biosynthesis
MHIFISIFFNAQHGGLHLNVLDSVEALIKEGHEVTVLSKDGMFSEKVTELGAISLITDFLDIEDTVTNIIQNLKKSPDIIHAHPGKSREVALVLNNHYKAPLILTLHSLYLDKLFQYHKKLDAIFVVSELIKHRIIEEIEDIDRKKIFILHNGIDIDYYRGLEKIKPKIGFDTSASQKLLIVSRYDKDKTFIVKSLVYMLETILKRREFELEIIVVGNGTELYLLKELAVKINAEANKNIVKFLGWMDKESFIGLYDEADISIGAGRSVIESLSFGLPTIALGSKGYIGIIDNSETIQAGIDNNFGGNWSIDDTSHQKLYQDIHILVNYSKKEKEKIGKLSQSIVNTFYDLKIINNTLVNLYSIFSLTKPIAQKVEDFMSNVNKSLIFDQSKWSFNTKENIKDAIFYDNSVRVELNDKLGSFYLIHGSKYINALPSQKFDVIGTHYFFVECKISMIDVDVKLYILDFSESEKIGSSAYTLKEGENNLKHVFTKGSKYVKFAFRAESQKEYARFTIDKLNVYSSLEESSERKEYFMKAIPHVRDQYTFQRGVSTYSILESGTEFNFYLNFTKNSKLLIGFTGAIDRTKPIYNFHRFSWSEDMDYSFMSVLDPTIQEENNLEIGWFQGKYNSYPLLKFVTLLKKLFKENNISEEEVMFFGSSAGGFVSLQMANFFPKSKIVVINPQIYIYKYYQSKYEELRKYAYPKLTNADIQNQFANRVSINIDFSQRVAPVYYYQNREDKHHFVNHLEKYLETLDEKIVNRTTIGNQLIENKKLHVVEYSDPVKKHTPPNKTETLRILEQAFNGEII